MPEISNLNIIKITPERFLIACSPAELFEVDMLLNQRRFQDRMSGITGMITPHQDVSADGSDQEITHQLMEAMKND